MKRLTEKMTYLLFALCFSFTSYAQTPLENLDTGLILAPELKFHPKYVHSNVQTQLMKEGLNSLTQEALPALARRLNLDDIRISQIQIKSDQFIAKKKPFKGNVCYNWRFYITDFRAHIDPDDRSLSGQFGNNREVQTTWNLSEDDFWMQGTFRFVANPVDRCMMSPGPLGMATPIPHKLPPLDLAVTVTIRGLERNGELDFRLVKASTHAVQIDSVTRNTLMPKRVLFEENRLVRAVEKGISIATMFGLDSCNSLESCAKHLYKKYLQEDPRIINPLLAALNNAMNVPLVKSGNINQFGFKLGYNVGLEGLSTISSSSGNRLNADWSVKLNMFDKIDKCADKVSYKPVGNPTSYTWGNRDLNIAVPYDALGNVVYASAIQGLLCRTFSNHYASWGYRVSVKPYGQISLARKSASSLSIYLPLRISGMSSLSHYILPGKKADASGTVDVTFEATIGFSVADSKIIFSLNNLQINKLSGNLTLSVAGQKLPITLPANQLQPLFQRIMDYLTNDLPTLTVPVKLPVYSQIGLTVDLANLRLMQNYFLAGMDFNMGH